MGQRIVKYHEYLKQKGGMSAQMRFAMKTSITSTSAEGAPDSPENLAKCKAAAKEIIGEDLNF